MHQCPTTDEIIFIWPEILPSDENWQTLIMVSIHEIQQRGN